MSLILISAPEFLPQEVEHLQAMFAAGLEVLHLRKPRAKPQEMRSFLRHFSEAQTKRMMLHQAWEWAREIPVRGLHLKSEAQFGAKSEAILSQLRSIRLEQPQLMISMALHDPKKAVAWSKEVDYGILSPIWPSLSKPGYKNDWDLDKLKDQVRECPIPLYALGGVTVARVAQAQKMNFIGVASLGSVWQAADPLASLLELKQACERAWKH